MRASKTKRALASDEHPAFSSDTVWSVDRSTAHRCWSIDLGGVLVDVQTTDTDWPPGEDIGRRIAFEREIERALRRLVGPMNVAVQGSMFDEVNDDV
jgi:hypothetical protein